MAYPSGSLKTILWWLTGQSADRPSGTGIVISRQFNPADEDSVSVARNLNSAFLLALSEPDYSLYTSARNYLNEKLSDPQWGAAARFYSECVYFVEEELESCYRQDADFARAVNRFEALIKGPGNLREIEAAAAAYAVFFPEGADLLKDPDTHVLPLRDKRRVTVTQLNPDPVTDPADQILFTSNILLTVPPDGAAAAGLPDSLKRKLEEIAGEKQQYWYDHPIPIGTEKQSNEILHGLQGLNETVRYEREAGNIKGGGKAACLLSVSATHPGLSDISRRYVEDVVRTGGKLSEIDVYLVTEKDTSELLEKVLLPAAHRYCKYKDHGPLAEVVGVDGKYGRHFSFLKAVSALWQVFVKPSLKGTFKFDLDQVFPQDELVAQTGKSAFGHLMTPLWGARGIDSGGEEVELGMIAGALVNESDMENGLYTPDVKFHKKELSAVQWVFNSSLPQALSTQAEMTARYAGEAGQLTECFQRVHVTGGTCGILTDSLRKYRPFTPSFIGRAEDQAYLMSVLFAGDEPYLRYVHGDGLIMRHDKETFAHDAIKAAALGREVGDIARILLFTSYTNSLPWYPERIKELLDPFTGCFISRIPVTVVCLRLALKTASLFSTESEDDWRDGSRLLQLAASSLFELVRETANDLQHLTPQFWREKEGWDLYYDILDAVEENIARGDIFALELKDRVNTLVETWCIVQGPEGDLQRFCDC